jgi:hypothetical protein
MRRFLVVLVSLLSLVCLGITVRERGCSRSGVYVEGMERGFLQRNLAYQIYCLHPKSIS